jgi:TolB-like protein/class 3 adenylate cyclase/Tfp pilus assembly protein PilF
MSPSRRSVATVLFTDIVGSTETAERLGDRAWRDLLAQHHALVRNQLRRFEAEEIATAGDGFLAVFESPALALLCATAIRDAVRELGLEIRTGVHHGEIQRDAGTVGGIAVHIGARVAALAGAGEILVSGTVRDAVQGAGFEFDDQGERELKGVTGPWHLYALTGTPEHLEDELLAAPSDKSHVRRLILPGLAIVAVAAALGFLAFRTARDRSEATSLPSPSDSLDVVSPIDRSIAVLPFDLRSSNEDDAFFARGMHDDLLTQLAQIDSLKVISRTSVERYAGTTTPVRQIGEELGVATVLEGAVQRSGDRIRLNVQLIDARKDEHLWAASYDEELTAANLFKIQTDLARRIAGALRARLRSAGEAALGAQPTQSLEAYLHWARGVSIAESGFSRSDREVAAREFREAIQADSSYALAWAELADIELDNWFLGHRPAEEAFPAARSAVDRALALEPDLAIAHVISGSLYMIQWRFDEAEIAFLRAIELAPGLGLIHRMYSGLLFVLERFEEAEVEAVRALELDPLNAELIQHLGWVRWAQRDWDGAIREAHRALEIDPNHSDAHNLLGNAYGRKGDHAAAFKAIETGRQRNPTEWWWTIALANAHARAGNRTEALRLLQRMPPDASGPLRRLTVAVVYVTLGDADRAFALNDPLVQEDPYILLYLGYDRDFDPIRDDPRFEDVRRRAREEVMRRNATY